MVSDANSESLQCLRCKTTLKFIGRNSFREGFNWGVFGGLGELFETSEDFDVYACPNCRHVELLLPDPLRDAVG